MHVGTDDVAFVPDDTDEVGNVCWCWSKVVGVPDDTDVVGCVDKTCGADITPDDADVEDVAPEDAVLFTLSVASGGANVRWTPDDVDVAGCSKVAGSNPNGFWTTSFPETV